MTLKRLVLVLILMLMPGRNTWAKNECVSLLKAIDNLAPEEFFSQHWPPVTLQELASKSADPLKSLPVVLRTENDSGKETVIAGDLRFINLNDEIKIAILTDRIGQTHLFELNSVWALAYPVESLTSHSLDFARYRGPSLVKISPDKVICLACELNQMLEAHPELETFREALLQESERGPKVSKRRFYEKMANFWSSSLAASFVIWGGTGIIRDVFGVRNLFTLHEDNFFMSAAFAGALYNILASLRPKYRNLFLYSAAAQMVLVNYLFEMSSSPLRGMHHNNVTDWGDFNSGVAGVATFYAVSLISEHPLNFKLKEQCSRAKALLNRH